MGIVYNEKLHRKNKKGNINEKEKMVRTDLEFKKKSHRAARQWTKEETFAVLMFFQNYVKTNDSAPGKKLCDECIGTSQTVLNNRSWKDVKYFVYNYLKKLKNPTTIK